jgi:hypothetical protein
MLTVILSVTRCTNRLSRRTENISAQLRRRVRVLTWEIIMVPAFIPRLYPRNKPLPAIEVSASNNSHVEVRFPAPAKARVMDTSPNRRFEYSHLASKVCIYTDQQCAAQPRCYISSFMKRMGPQLCVPGSWLPVQIRQGFHIVVDLAEDLPEVRISLR